MNTNHRTLWIIVLVLGLCLCCCALAVSAGLIAGALGWTGSTFGNGLTSAAEPFERAVAVRGPLTLVVDAPVGDVTVQAGTDGEVAVRATKRAWGISSAAAQEALRRIEISVVQTGEQVRVQVSGLEETQRLGRTPQVTLQITVPRNTALTLTSRVGKVTVSGLRGDLDLRADVGDVTLRDVTPVKSLLVQTRVANIELSGPLAGGAAYDLSSDVGRVALRLPADSAFKLDARSDVGDVQVDFTVSGSSSRSGLVSKEVVGEVGANPTTTLRLRSRVGAITVDANR